ncbi:MAG: lipid II flippase MurJ, partial [Acidobacteriota bacterium]
HFSEMVVRADWTSLRHTLRTYTRLIVILTLPLTLGLVFFSEPLVRAIFERGAFTPHDTQLVARVQVCYALQVPLYTLGIMGVRLLSALGRNHTLMWISFLNLIVNIIGNYLLMRILGVAGIALSTSIVYAFSLSLVAISVAGQLRHRATR